MANEDDVRWLAMQSVLATLIHEMDQSGKLGLGRTEIIRKAKALVRACTSPRMDVSPADKLIDGVNEVLHQIR